MLRNWWAKYVITGKKHEIKKTCGGRAKKTMCDGHAFFGPGIQYPSFIPGITLWKLD
jgi:hypothetical protein